MSGKKSRGKSSVDQEKPDTALKKPKKNLTSRTIIDAKSRLLVSKLKDFFAKERDTLSPGFDPDDPLGRTACALKLDVKTVKDIIQGRFTGCDEDSDSESEDEKDTVSVETTDWYDLDCIKIEAIRQLIREMTMRCEVITRPKIKKQLKKNNLTPIHRSLSCVLSHMGYYWKECLTQHILLERDDYVSKRCKFLRKMEGVKLEDVVWIGFTCMYSTCINKVAYIPSKRETINRGGRVIVMHAGSSKGWFDVARYVEISKKTLPYLEDIGTKEFAEWFERLMVCIPSNSVIVMEDNAVTTDELDKAPKEHNTREEIIDWLGKHNVWINNNGSEFSKAELLGIVSETKPFYPIYTVDELAIKFGHQVVRIPEYHAHFNPIEKLFLRIQKSVELKAGASGGFSQSDIQMQTIQALGEIKPKDWSEAVKQVGKLIVKYQEQEPKLQEAVEAIIANILKLKKNGHAIITKNGVFEKQAISDKSDEEETATHSKKKVSHKKNYEMDSFFEKALAAKKLIQEKQAELDVITQVEMAEAAAAKELSAFQKKTKTDVSRIDATIEAAKQKVAHLESRQTKKQVADRKILPNVPKRHFIATQNEFSGTVILPKRFKTIVRPCQIPIPQPKIQIPAQFNIVQPSIVQLPPGATIPAGYIKIQPQIPSYIISNIPGTQPSNSLPTQSSNTFQVPINNHDNKEARMMLPSNKPLNIDNVNGTYQVVYSTQEKQLDPRCDTPLPSDYLETVIKTEPLDEDSNTN